MMICEKCNREFPSSKTVCPIDGLELIPAPPDPLVGTTFAERFEILERVGGGGDGGAVYKARHLHTHSMVAIRVFSSEKLTNPSAIENFKLEAKKLSSLEHPNILNILEFGLTGDDRPFLITRYLNGTTLGAFLDYRSRMEMKRALHLFAYVCDGLSYAHSQHVLHGDLKPGNLIFVEEEPPPRQIAITDFGLAKMHLWDEQPSSKGNDSFESPLYMSPEQCQNWPLDQRSDLYSLACVIYHTITAMPPVMGTNAAETLRMQVHEIPLSMRGAAPELDIPEAIETTIMKALNKDPMERQQTVAQFKAELVQSAQKNGIFLPDNSHHHTQHRGFVGHDTVVHDSALLGHDGGFVGHLRELLGHPPELQRHDRLVEETASLRREKEQNIQTLRRWRNRLIILGCLFVFGVGAFTLYALMPGPAEDPAPNWQKEIWRMTMELGDKDLEAKNYASAANHFTEASKIGHKMGRVYDNEIRALLKLLDVYNLSNHTLEAEKVREQIVALHFDRVATVYAANAEMSGKFAVFQGGLMRSGEVRKLHPDFVDRITRNLLAKTRVCIKNKQFLEAQSLMNEAVTLKEQAPGNNKGELAQCAAEFQVELNAHQPIKEKLKEIDKLLLHAQEIDK